MKSEPKDTHTFYVCRAWTKQDRSELLGQFVKFIEMLCEEGYDLEITVKKEFQQ